MKSEESVYKQLYDLLSKAEDITIEYSNPLINDVGGAIDCQKILTHIQECLLILVKYHEI